MLSLVSSSARTWSNHGRPRRLRYHGGAVASQALFLPAVIQYSGISTVQYSIGFFSPAAFSSAAITSCKLASKTGCMPALGRTGCAHVKTKPSSKSSPSPTHLPA